MLLLLLLLQLQLLLLLTVQQPAPAVHACQLLMAVRHCCCYPLLLLRWPWACLRVQKILRQLVVPSLLQLLLLTPLLLSA